MLLWRACPQDSGWNIADIFGFNGMRRGAVQRWRRKLGIQQGFLWGEIPILKNGEETMRDEKMSPDEFQIIIAGKDEKNTTKDERR